MQLFGFACIAPRQGRPTTNSSAIRPDRGREFGQIRIDRLLRRHVGVHVGRRCLRRRSRPAVPLSAGTFGRCRLAVACCRRDAPGRRQAGRAVVLARKRRTGRFADRGRGTLAGQVAEVDPRLCVLSLYRWKTGAVFTGPRPQAAGRCASVAAARERYAAGNPASTPAWSSC